jgi:hypothetical protein
LRAYIEIADRLGISERTAYRLKKYYEELKEVQRIKGCRSMRKHFKDQCFETIQGLEELHSEIEKGFQREVLLR